MSAENFMVRVAGSKRSFRCEGEEGRPCGCNVFQKSSDEPWRFVCNACGAAYVGVTAETFTDDDGHCSRCGLGPEEGVTHQCPPGFMDTPDRTARLVAALKGIRAKLESESPEFDDYSPIDDLDAALKEFEP